MLALLITGCVGAYLLIAFGAAVVHYRISWGRSSEESCVTGVFWPFYLVLFALAAPCEDCDTGTRRSEK
jgi:hypothetical protein